MARKGENIYKRKDGRWEGRYKKGRKENGQLKYGYLYGTTYTEVKERLYRYKLMYQEMIQTHGESTLTYEEWAFSWLAQRQKQIKLSTYSTYFYKLKRYVFPTIGFLPLNQLTSKTIQSLVNQWEEKGLEATTIHVLYQIIKKSLKDAVQQERLYRNPCENVLLPKKKKRKVTALSRGQQMKLESQSKKRPLYKGLPVLLGLQAGLRIGEIAALKWEDVDFSQRVIHIHQTYQRLSLGKGQKKTQLSLDSSKTDRSIREIPISHNLYKYLRKWYKRSTSNYVCSNSEKPVEPRLLTYYFHQIRQDCQIESIHFHQLRHTFATRCIETNGDIASISHMLGHQSTKTTLDIYTDSFLEQRKLVIAQMER